jgi:RNA 3'-terminal phosphate cyclase (ATP)
MLEIDGSQGEGGGQVLRSSLTLSILMRQAVHIKNLRLGRSKPGLQPQHLKAVDAAGAISRAEVEGASLGSTRLSFSPGEVRTGRYVWDIGTAGSTSLVLQTIFLPLSLAGSASSVIITGGTHVPAAPCYHYLDMLWLPFMLRLGCNARLSLEECGFYPQGGGRINATIRPARSLKPILLEERRELTHITGISAVANLDARIAERQKRWASGRLYSQFPNLRIKIDQLKSRFKGTILLLYAEFASASDEFPAAACCCALGALGKPAERVADEAVDALLAFLASDGAVDPHLADQLLVPLAFAHAESRFRTSRVTRHLQTNAEVINRFQAARVTIDGSPGEPGLVCITPASR